jgi:hypothetical protein
MKINVKSNLGRPSKGLVSGLNGIIGNPPRDPGGALVPGLPSKTIPASDLTDIIKQKMIINVRNT